MALTQSQQDYYDGDNFGGYQVISLQSIIDNFLASHVGEGKILQKVPDKLQKIDQFKDGRPYAIAVQELDNISAAGAKIIDKIDEKLIAIGDRDFGEGVERFGSKLSYA